MATSSIVTSASAKIPRSAPPTSYQTLQDNAQTVTNTTTVDKTAGNILTGVSIIPYMRSIAIDFLGYRLRPNREIWFYFDGVGVNRFVQRPNIIEVKSSNTVSDLRSGSQKVLNIGSAAARILHVERDLDSGNSIFYVSEFTSPSVFAENDTVIVNIPGGYTTSLYNYSHYSGLVQANTTNTEIVMSSDANAATDEYYLGNTITILNGTNAGQSAEIVSYNCLSRIAYVNPALNINPNDDQLIYTIGDYRSWYASNNHPSSYTTSRGMISGVLHIPDPNKNPDSKFKTGDKIFRIIDNPVFGLNDPNLGVGRDTTRAEYRFVADGLDQSIAQILIRKDDPDVPVPSPTPTRSFTPTQTKTLPVTPITPTPTKTSSNPITPTRTNTPDPTNTPTRTVGVGPVSQPTRTPTKVPPDTSPLPVTKTPAKTPTKTPPKTPSKTPPQVSKSNSRKCTAKYVTQYLGRGEWTRSCSSCCPSTGSYGLSTGSDQYPGQPDQNAGCQGRNDPIAQTFFVSGRDAPDGLFISSVDLFFKNKGELLPIEVQIRPVQNGIPRNDVIIPGATTTVDIEDINVSNFPNTSNSLTATRFTFPSPVYLNAGYEYAIVAVTDDFGYDYYSAELGGTVIGTDRKISKQPHLGTFLKSQMNGSAAGTWTPLANEDLMFVLNKAQFTSTSGTAIFDEDKVALYKEISSNVAYNAFDDLKANTYYDALHLRSDAIEINNTKLSYYFKGTSNTTKVLDTTYTNFNPDKRFDLEERKIIFNPQLENKSMTVRIDLSTKNPDVSPVIYHNRQNMITIENLINDTGLTADRFTITSPGEEYYDTAPLTITSNVGYGANGWAIVDPETRKISSIYIDSPGVGYVDDVVVTVGGENGIGANVSVSTETGSSGGPALARYISKTVTLLDGFDAGDLRIFLTAVKPPGSNVNVYYKVRNALDPQKIEDRDWVRMTQKTSQYTFSVNRQPVEYEYRPSLTSNNITYSTDTTTYKTFNQFAIKIVLSSRSTVANSIPYVLDVRATALPEDAY
jgi:hypothetical protein